jgi:hypothetical protein
MTPLRGVVAVPPINIDRNYSLEFHSTSSNCLSHHRGRKLLLVCYLFRYLLGNILVGARLAYLVALPICVIQGKPRMRLTHRAEQPYAQGGVTIALEQGELGADFILLGISDRFLHV